MADETDLGDASQPVPSSGIWNDRRRALRTVLGKQDLVCAELYGRALDAFSELPLTSGAMVIASHCIRELVNRLPRVLGDTLPTRGTSLTKAAEGLAAAWADHGDSLSQAVQAGERVPSEGLSAVIPHVGEVVEAFHSGRVNALGLRSMLATGNSIETDNPTVKRLKRSTDVFESYRHPQGSTDGWPQNVEPLLQHLQVIEDAIEGRIGSFFDVALDLKSLLIEANSRGSASGRWDAPSDELVTRVISRIGDVQHRRIFFSALRNPLWVAKLLEAGVLDPPPRSGDDVHTWVSWPAGPYLVVAAANAPVDVAVALHRINERASNHEVHEHVVKAAAVMPADVVSGLVSVIKSIPAVPLDPSLGLGIAVLIEKLGKGGKENAALKLGNALLRPKVPPDDGQVHSHAVAGIEVYWYDQALQHFIKGLTGSTKLLSTLAVWLELSMQAEGVDPKAEYDPTYIHRPSIGTRHSQRGREKISDSLIDSTRDTAIAEIRAGTDPATVMGQLERNGYPILKRIARHVLAQIVADTPSAIGLAHERLLDRSPLDGATTPHEYLDLARASLPLLDDIRYGEWEAAILAGPRDTERKHAKIRDHLEPGRTEADAWSEYVEQWLLNVLGTIGTESLRGTTSVRLAKLAAAHGDPVDPSPVGFQIVNIDREESTLLAELRGKSVPEAIGFARTWKAPSQDHWNSDHVAVGQAFATVVKERASEFSVQASDVLTLPELFVDRFFDGLRNALDAEDPVEWTPLLEALMALPAESTTQGQGKEDRRWSYPIMTVLHVIEKALSETTSGFMGDHISPAIDFVLRYVQDPDPAPDAPGSLEGLDGDPIMRAINSVQPVAIATAVRLAHYAKATENDSAALIIERVLERLSEVLEPERIESSSVAASFGSSFGQLNWIAPEWVASHADQLLSEDWYGDIVAIVALLYYNRPGFFFDVMTPKLSQFIARAAEGEEFGRSWTQQVSVIERVGVHLSLMTLSGEREPSDELVEQYFREVPAATRGAVLGEIGRLLTNGESMPSEVIKRAQDLWDRRAAVVAVRQENAAELREFYLWVRSRKFPIEWWLPRLRAVAELTGFEGLNYLGEHLVEAAAIDATMTLEILDTLIRVTSTPWVRHDLVDHAPPVIARGLASGHEATVEAARDLMDYLGREGYLGIADLVEDAVASLDDREDLAE